MCTYTAQGFLLCEKPKKVEKETKTFFESFRQSVGSCTPVKLQDEFSKWNNPTDPSHIFNACDKASCEAKSCSCSGANKSCVVSCKKCSYCKGKGDWFVGDKTMTNSTQVQLTGPKAIKDLYFCGNGRLQDKPCTVTELPKITQSKC